MVMEKYMLYIFMYQKCALNNPTLLEIQNKDE